MTTRDRTYHPDFLAGLSEAERDDEVAPSSALRARIVASVQPGHRFDGFAARVAEIFELGRDAVGELLRAAESPDAESWFDAAPGVRALDFDAGGRLADAHCGVVLLDVAASFPMHHHVGDEWIFVLSGEGEDSLGHRLRPGELIRSAAGSEHEIRCVGDEALIFLAAAVGGIRRTD